MAKFNLGLVPSGQILGHGFFRMLKIEITSQPLSFSRKNKLIQGKNSLQLQKSLICIVPEFILKLQPFGECTGRIKSSNANDVISNDILPRAWT